MIPAADGMPIIFTDAELKLRGPDTIWGRSLLLRSTAYNTDLRTCANIASDGDAKTVEAKFSSPVAGTVIFRQSELGETTIFANIFHITEEYTPSTNHEWRILATDILDTAKEASRKRRCEYLQVSERNFSNWKISLGIGAMAGRNNVPYLDFETNTKICFSQIA